VRIPNIQPVLFLDGLVGDARPHHLGEAIDVNRVHVEAFLDLLAHGVGPWLGPEDAAFQRGAARVNSLPLELIGYGKQIGWGDHDDVRLEILDQLAP